MSQHSANNTLLPGLYRHYKGHDYQVIDTATHSEDESLYVIYRPLYGEGKLWIRPFSMFTETVLVDGKQIPRFAYVGPMGESA
ncbi:DUF1653 domain-containing protein [Planctobacterium marinum]|uniref:DUF1653 domain-containing protein n=1 Tax=Planctobacterium marinum TaxID=1631968 RepID=UPI001E2B107D|nr:DUF1653 domain-containing protein [Planctobacterium marinum]MCC2605156.1 DUF1653 domain-containing protein [Planctobacterium marinum]